MKKRRTQETDKEKGGYCIGGRNYILDLQEMKKMHLKYKNLVCNKYTLALNM